MASDTFPVFAGFVTWARMNCKQPGGSLNVFAVAAVTDAPCNTLTDPSVGILTQAALFAVPSVFALVCCKTIVLLTLLPLADADVFTPTLMVSVTEYGATVCRLMLFVLAVVAVAGKASVVMKFASKRMRLLNVVAGAAAAATGV